MAEQAKEMRGGLNLVAAEINYWLSFRAFQQTNYGESPSSYFCGYTLEKPCYAKKALVGLLMIQLTWNSPT